MKKYIYTLALLLSLGAQAKSGLNRVVDVANDDKVMVAAIKKAQTTLPTFLALHDHPPEGALDFKLKVNIDGEHMWVMPFEQTNDGFSGTLANTPEKIMGLELGDTIEFTQDMISDWGYSINGEQKGSYTVCALTTKMSKSELRELKQLGFRCAH